MDLRCILNLGFAWRIRARLSLLLHSTTADRNSTGFGGKIVEKPVELVKVSRRYAKKSMV